MTSGPAALRSFSSVDAQPDAASLIAGLDEQASIPAIQRLRATAVELLGARLGHRVLDAGCGTGDVARALAGVVGRTGSVVGVEASGAMLAEARRRAAVTLLPIEFRHGDVCGLDLDDASFDAVLSERVLQHLANPEQAVAELCRVTRHGGRVVVIDTDWGLHAVHGADTALTAAVLDAWCDNAANPWSGRRLPGLLADAGLRAITLAVETITSTDPGRATVPPFTTMAAHAERCGAIGAGDAEAWLAQLADSGRRGRFVWALTMFAVAGTRP
jgi:ubiquinone/menaquinone biosynthesis C-methylase UbiE